MDGADVGGAAAIVCAGAGVSVAGGDVRVADGAGKAVSVGSGRVGLGVALGWSVGGSGVAVGSGLGSWVTSAAGVALGKAGTTRVLVGVSIPPEAPGRQRTSSRPTSASKESAIRQRCRGVTCIYSAKGMGALTMSGSPDWKPTGIPSG